MQNPVALYNLSPIIQLLVVGAVIGGIPLIWIWVKKKHLTAVSWLQYLTLLIAFLTFDLILFGAFTRLTDSGLGCPDWPGCYGSASPLGAVHHIIAAELHDPYGPVSWFKAWVEMLHRYFASGIGFLIIVLTLCSWYQRQKINISPWWATVTLIWVILQGAFGVWTVTMKLLPAVVTAHLLAGIFLLALVRVQTIKLTHYAIPQAARDAYYQQVTLATKVLIGLTLAVLVLQLALGGWVSSNYAVLACGAEFPTCSNSLSSPWWPEMDFKQGFTLWRELHHNDVGESLSLAALTAIHYTHRIVGYVLIVLSLITVWRLRGYARLRFWNSWLLVLILAQTATGISTVLFNRPLLFAVLHTAGATVLVLILVSMWYLTKSATNMTSSLNESYK